jgi:NAD(P)-dependent dehydrogenase (short-subunit alcohol dehydrogenase family)
MARILEGKAAIITGGGRGIGRAVAEALGGPGASIVISARSENELKEAATAVAKAGGRAVTVAGSVAEEKTASRLVEACYDSFGDCDILINNAAITGPVGEVESLDPKLFDEMLRINITGTFLPIWALLPEMKKRRTGRIINVASNLAIRVQPGQAGYSMSKAAIVHFTRVLAEEVREHGIYANSVGPGIVRTAMVNDLIALPGGGFQGAIAKRMGNLKETGVLIEPAEAARLFVWLAAAAKRNGEFLRYDDLELRNEIKAFHDGLK